MRDDVKSLVKSSLKAAMDRRYHAIHRAQATSILRTIEKARGRTDPSHLKLADAYARDALGSPRYAPWLYVYAAMAGTFRDGWIPDNYYGLVVIPKMKGAYGEISNLKSIAGTVFDSDAFPDVAYFVNGLFLTAGKSPIPQNEAAKFIFADAEDVVYKTDHSYQGKGVFFFDRKNFDVEAVKRLGNGVFQRRIRQHQTFDDFSPAAVATIRMTTVVDDAGDLSPRACYLRFGRSADSHVRSSTHVRVPVDISDGAFLPQGYLTTWLAVEEHPDTKRAFSGHKIPAFSKCVATALALHKKMPFARCIGWDMAIDSDENVRVMEWNATHNDIKFSEATQGPCFADLRWDLLSRR